MVREYKTPGFYSDQERAFGQDEGPEFELALALQNGQPGDVHLLETLVERYGTEIYRLVFALLDANYPELPPADQICALVEEIFAEAIGNLNHFWGEASVREWLFAIAVDRFDQYQRWQEIKHFLNTSDQAGEIWKKPERSKPQNFHDSDLWARVDDLPQGERLAIILYYLFNFDIPRIARFLKATQARIAEGIFTTLDRCLDAAVQAPAGGYKVPSGIQEMIQAEITGRLKDDIYRQDELRQHLSGCEDCRRYLKELDELATALAAALRRRWSQESLTAGEARGLFEGARSRLGRSKPLRRLAVTIQKGAWIGIAMMLFVGIAWAVTRSGLLVDELPVVPAPATPVPMHLPEPIEIPVSAASLNGSKAAQQIPDFMYNAEPSLSADGDWVAFTHYDAFTRENQSSSLPEIILYHRIDQSMIRINDPTEDSHRTDWGFNPSISANGRWVVYTSGEEGPSGSQSNGCIPFARAGECMAIFLFDRETGNAERIDRSYDGSKVNGDSYDPKISASGRWLIFWSTANNLIADGLDVCAGETSSPGRCGNLYLYDREAQEIKQILIGRSREQQISGGKPDVSADGRFIAFTVHKDDWIAGELGLTNEREAVVYDVKKAIFSIVNISSDGSTGNGNSYAPSISANGHFVAFVSEASNLVPQDTNGASDIFVQDLETRRIERASVSGDGGQGNNSGDESSIGWGPVVDISGDGRFVVFTSGLDGLTNKPPSSCDHPQENMCNSIYVHDRETGRTESVIPPQENRNYLFPEMSAEGQWVSFMEMAPECSGESGQQVCGEVWIYDRQNEWIRAVSKGRFQYPRAHLFSTQVRDIPEVGANIAISPDGESVATVFNARNHTSMINLWGLRGGTHNSFILGDRNSTITSLAFSPDGQYLAAGTQEGNAKIWRLANQQLGYDMDGQTGRVIKIRYSADSRRIAIGTQHSVWVWELRDKVFVRVAVRELQGDGPVDLDISPDAKWAALAMQDRTVWLQNIQSGKVVLRVENEDKNLVSVTFSPDGTVLAVGSSDGSLHLWKLVEDGKGALRAIYVENLAHPNGVSKVAFSPDGNLLASLTLDGILQTWSLPEGPVLDTFPGPGRQWDRVNTFALSPKGDLLATSSWTGPTRIFRSSPGVDNQRFFVRAESDNLSIPLAFPPESSLWEWQSQPITLYQANSLLNFELQAPVYLPPGMIFSGVHRARTDDAAQLKYDYYEDPNSTPKGSLFINEEPMVPEISDMPLGQSARVETARVKDANAEFVEGDWVPEGNRTRDNSGFGGLVPMIWDREAAFLRLRFQAGTRLISIFYKQVEVENGAFPYLNKADLVAIAQSLVNVNRSFQTAPITISYTAQEGDTCTSIASRFGTTIGEILRLNDLAGNCDVIYEGQTLTVPLSETRETLTETDLDCDGRPERISVIPNPVATGTRTFLGVIVERLADNGFYQNAWQYTIADTDLRLFTQPQIFRVNDCAQDLALNLIPRNAAFTQFEIFHWDGETMVNAVGPDTEKSPAP